MTETTYDGLGETMEAAIQAAHAKIPPRPGRDYAASKVTGFGMQRGGFIDQVRYWVELVEDRDRPFQADG